LLNNRSRSLSGSNYLQKSANDISPPGGGGGSFLVQLAGAADCANQHWAITMATQAFNTEMHTPQR